MALHTPGRDKAARNPSGYQGSVAEQGTHAELMQRGGVYSSLARAQEHAGAPADQAEGAGLVVGQAALEEKEAYSEYEAGQGRGVSALQASLSLRLGGSSARERRDSGEIALQALERLGGSAERLSGVLRSQSPRSRRASSDGGASPAWVAAMAARPRRSSADSDDSNESSGSSPGRGSHSSRRSSGSLSGSFSGSVSGPFSAGSFSARSSGRRSSADASSAAGARSPSPLGRRRSSAAASTSMLLGSLAASASEV